MISTVINTQFICTEHNISQESSIDDIDDGDLHIRDDDLDDSDDDDLDELDDEIGGEQLSTLINIGCTSVKYTT